jgi:hypothetical protein
VFINISEFQDCQDDVVQSFENHEMPPSYYAKLTTFANGGFELAVTLPSAMSHHRTTEPFSGKFGAIVHQIDKRRENEPTEEQKAAANLVRSVRRSRQKIRHTIKALEADHMLTLTYRENMQDVEKLKADFKRFARMMLARFPDWKYVCVRETQERGALHLHIAVKGRQPLNYIRKCWYMAIGGSVSDTGADTLGAINVRAPSRFSGRQGKSVKWKVEKLAGYLTKYLGKELEGASEHHAKRYWHSKTIVKPECKKFWLGATNFRDAIVEAHNLVYDRGADGLSIWAADDWKNIWISGGGLCPF